MSYYIHPGKFFLENRTEKGLPIGISNLVLWMMQRER